jgi:hypothetical protein
MRNPEHSACTRQWPTLSPTRQSCGASAPLPTANECGARNAQQKLEASGGSCVHRAAGNAKTPATRAPTSGHATYRPQPVERRRRRQRERHAQSPSLRRPSEPERQPRPTPEQLDSSRILTEKTQSSKKYRGGRKPLAGTAMASRSGPRMWASSKPGRKQIEAPEEQRLQR